MSDNKIQQGNLIISREGIAHKVERIEYNTVDARSEVKPRRLKTFWKHQLHAVEPGKWKEVEW